MKLKREFPPCEVCREPAKRIAGVEAVPLCSLHRRILVRRVGGDPAKIDTLTRIEVRTLFGFVYPDDTNIPPQKD